MKKVRSTFIRINVSVLCFMAILSCSSTSEMGDSGLYNYRVSLGQATSPDAQRYIEQIFRKYNFTIERSSLDGRVYYETSWLQRPPDDSERAGGIESVQTKIIITSRSGRALSGGVRSYSLEFSGLTEGIITGGGDGWERVQISSGSEASLQQIAQELRDEFSARFFGF